MVQHKETKRQISIVTIFAAFFGVLFTTVTLAPVFEHFGLAFLSRPIYFIGGGLCHQMYTRSIHLFDLQVAVCARDQFMYLAMMFAAIFTSKYKLKPLDWWLAAIFIMPASIDGSLQLFSSLGLIDLAYQSTILLRAITGTLMGCGLGFFLFPLLRKAQGEISRPNN